MPLGSLAGSGDDWNDAELLPEFGDGAQNSAFCHFPAQRMGEFGKSCVARFQQLVCFCKFKHMFIKIAQEAVLEILI